MSTLYTDPRSYVESKPVSTISHKGLRVAARSATVYTCKVPDRHQVAKQNYLRRSHQMKKCGYSSVTYKPYETVGKVYLDNRNLIMVALGQKKVENSEDESSDDQMLLVNKVLDAESDTKGADGQDLKHLTTEPQTQTSFKSHEKLENIQSELVKGRKMVSAVRLGCSVFRFIKDEQKKKAAEAEMERRRKLDDTKQTMKILSASSSDDSDDDESVAIKRVNQEIVANTEYDKCSDDAVNRLESTAYGLHSMNGSGEKCSENLLTVSKSSIYFLNPSRTGKNRTGKNSPRLKQKLRTSIRPYSAVYSNISYPEIDARESLFRQLCALNWILDAMSQDTFPPVVSPLTNCWNIRELYEEVRSSRRKVERQRQTESSWQTLLVNPGRFSQRDNRRGARRISVHPQHIQRLSAVTSSSSTVGLKTTSPERKPRHGSCSSTNPETYATEITTGESDWVPYEVQNETGKTTTGISTSAGKSQRNKLKTSKNISLNMNKYFTMTNNSTYSEKKTHTKQDNKSLLRRHLYRLTLSRRPESSSKKAESRVRAWVQQTGDPKIIHDGKQFNCSSGYQFMPGQGSPKTHFFTAALAAFGAIRVSNCTEKIPIEMRKRFSEITEEKKIMLNDKLEVQNKKRWNTLRRKFCSLDHSLHVREALEKMRKEVSFVETETREEMRQRVSEECKWYKNLINIFPDEIKYDPYISVILNKIARHGSLEGRKVSASHFLKVMGTLRTWELCYPEIAAAIEFVRENIVGFSSVEYDEWLSSQQSAKSSISAPGTPL